MRQSPRLCSVFFCMTILALLPIQAGAASSGCQALVQAAATGKAAQIKTDDAMIQLPESVTTFTCLDGFFNGIGPATLTNGLNLAAISQAAMGKVRMESSHVWLSLYSAAPWGPNASSCE